MVEVLHIHDPELGSEHVVYTLSLKEYSRALLQEAARHRVGSPSVKSSRYTLKELKNAEPFVTYANRVGDATEEIEELSIAAFHGNGYIVTPDQYSRASNYLVMTGDSIIDRMSVLALDNLRYVIQLGKSNDRAKYCMPEAYKTELVLTFGYKGLLNFLKLRTSSSALWEIQDLSNDILDALPNWHKTLFLQELKG